MLRQKTRQNPDKSCKIRKRVLSSSSSSSVGRNYRLKRAILVGKRVCSSTPVPNWKGIMDSGSRSSVQKLHNFEIKGVISSNNHNQIRKKEGFSARKLAATLWEINGLQSHGGDTAVFEKVNGSKVGAQKRRSSATLQKHENSGYVPNVEELDTAAKLSSIEVGKNNSSFKTRLKDVNKSLIVLKELVKELFRIITHEEQHSSRIILVSALRVELDRARLQIDTLSKNLAEDKVVWKNKGMEIIKEAVSSIEIERKLRRQSERLNKKLGVELANSRAHLSMAMKELEKEKRAKEILEHTCDVLAKGIGEERVEIENERKMMQLTDVFREERLQMKLTDAKYEYEEKNADLDRLKTDLDKKSDFRKKTQFGSFRNEEESGESELHSIELSMDEEVFKGRRSLSDKIQWENICLKRSISDGMEWEFSGRRKEQGNNVNHQGLIKSSSHGSASESPAISTGKSSCLREACNAIPLDLDSRKDYR